MRSQIIFCLALAITIFTYASQSVADITPPISLPKPSLSGTMSLEESIAKRRSIRNFGSAELNSKEISQLLWAAQGITGSGGKRAAPSAGARYPLRVYLVVGKVKGLETGIYTYKPHNHTLTKIKNGDFRKKLMAAALDQGWVGKAPASLVFAVNYGRMKSYKERGKMYADIEQGHAAQNVLLQTVALGLGAVPIGAMKTDELKAILDLPEGLIVKYIISVGKKAE